MPRVALTMPFTWGRSRETIYIIDSASHLEGADGSVVLVLDYDFDSEAPLEERPSVLRGWRHNRTYYGRRALKIV